MNPWSIFSHLVLFHYSNILYESVDVHLISQNYSFFFPPTGIIYLFTVLSFPRKLSKVQCFVQRHWLNSVLGHRILSPSWSFTPIFLRSSVDSQPEINNIMATTSVIFPNVLYANPPYVVHLERPCAAWARRTTPLVISYLLLKLFFVTGGKGRVLDWEDGPYSFIWNLKRTISTHYH